MLARLPVGVGLGFEQVAAHSPGVRGPARHVSTSEVLGRPLAVGGREPELTRGPVVESSGSFERFAHRVDSDA